MKTLTAASPELKLARRHAAATNAPWPMAPAQEDNSLAAEFDRLRECEANLRAYEERLRAWQERLVDGEAAAKPAPTPAALQGMSRGPFARDSALQEAWAKFYRAHELLEAEQNHLRDERMATRGREDEIQRREKAVAERELRLAERERLAAELNTALAAAPVPSKQTSRLGQFTQAPFALARAVFSAGK